MKQQTAIAVIAAAAVIVVAGLLWWRSSSSPLPGIQFTNTHFLFNKAGELVRVIPVDLKESDIVSLLES